MNNMISLVIPAYNEGNSVVNTINRVHNYFEKLDLAYEVIFVDDGSTDDTYSKIKQNKKENMFLVSYKQNRGKGFALRTGISKTSGDLVFFTDCDTAYGLDVIKKAIVLFQKTGADLVIGSRRLDEEGYQSYSFLRKLSSNVFSFIANRTLRLSLTDTQCGFKGFRGECARSLFSKCQIDGFGLDFELLYLASKEGFKIEQMPVRVLHHGASSIHLVRDSFRMLSELAMVRRLHG